MLKINNLEVATDNKIILKDFNLIINDGERLDSDYQIAQNLSHDRW